MNVAVLQPLSQQRAQIRAQFPALSRRIGGQPVGYFDGPGGTQVPESVIAAMRDYILNHNGNAHWAYPASEETDAMLASAREAARDLLNARSAKEIVFGANMTTLTFHLGRAIGRALRKGDEIVVTELDHHANIDPWKQMARDAGAVVRMVPFEVSTAGLDYAAFAEMITSRTRLVAIGAASNALGTVNDIPRVIKLARAAGAMVFVDAVHHAPHASIDVQALDCDFLACSAYKFHGPHVGILYGKKERLEALDIPRLAPAPGDPPEKFETGTLNFEGIAGVLAAIEFLASLADPSESSTPRRGRLVSALSRIEADGHETMSAIWRGLSSIPGVNLHGPAPDRPRTGTVSFRIRGKNSAAVTKALAQRALFVSHGDFYAQGAVAKVAREPDGLVRVGTACYTTEEEVSRLLDGVGAIARQS